MHFKKLRAMSACTSAVCVIGNYKKVRIPSGNRRVLSVGGRHNDDRRRNAPGVFRKVSETFF